MSKAFLTVKILNRWNDLGHVELQLKALLNELLLPDEMDEFTTW